MLVVDDKIEEIKIPKVEIKKIDLIKKNLKKIKNKWMISMNLMKDN